MASMNVRKDDTVVVLSGKNKGKQGKVLETDPKAGKVIVQGVNIVTQHRKPSRNASKSDRGGITKKEAPIYACKVMRVCPKCSQPTRPASKILPDGEKVRVCKRCGAEI
jgi:large subunit ribosomal protein L24